MCIIAYGIKKDIGNQRFQNCLTNNPDGFFLLGFKGGNEDNKPDIPNIPRPTITQKNTTHSIANQYPKKEFNSLS